jgi:hypothetical protein
MILRRFAVLATFCALAACGGGGHKTATTAASAAPSAPMGTAEPVPAMNCGGTQPVWVNERSRVFHLAGDPYYGRTKHGKYMCERDAAKAGYRPSKT